MKQPQITEVVTNVIQVTQVERYVWIIWSEDLSSTKILKVWWYYVTVWFEMV
jgi:hypothetical protein